MPDQYLDVFLTKEDFMLRDMIRGFVDKEIMPVRQQVDEDKDHVIVRRILQGLTDLGLQKSPFPPEYGGMGAKSAVSAGILHEELSRGDSGICTACNVTGWAWIPAIAANNKAVLDRFAPEFTGKELRMGCFNMTEPGGPHGGGGCDIENLNLQGRKIRTIAKLEGDEWVINGQKMWASNCGVADLYCMVCSTDPNLGDEGIALIYVPKDAKGISFGKDEHKAGMAGADQAALHRCRNSGGHGYRHRDRKMVLPGGGLDVRPPRAVWSPHVAVYALEDEHRQSVCRRHGGVGHEQGHGVDGFLRLRPGIRCGEVLEGLQNHPAVGRRRPVGTLGRVPRIL